MDAGLRKQLKDSRQKASEGHVEDAIKMVQAILAATQEALRLMADLRLRLGDREAAEVALQQAVALDPQDVKSALQLSRLLEADRPSEAEAQLRRILPIAVDHIEVMIQLARLCQRHGDPAEGIALLCQALATNSSNARANLRIAELLESDDPGAAEVHLHRVLAQQPDNSSALLRLSSIAQRRGALDEAMAHMRHLLQVDPANEKAALRLASLLESVDLEKAEDQLRQILCRDPTSKGALLSLARVREKRQDQAEAARILHHLAAQHPADADVGLRHALILAATGCTAEAVAVLQRLADSSAASAKILFKLGDLKRQNGDLAGAEEIFARLVAMQPDNTQAWLRLANAQHAAGSTERALITLERLLTSAPDNAAALLRKAEALRLMADLRIRLGDREAAEVALRQAVALDPQDVRSALQLSRLLEADRPSEAEAQLRRLLPIAVDHTEVMIQLARLCQRHGDPAEAIALLRQALATNPSNVKANLRLAELLESDDPGTAEVHLHRVLAQQPDNSSALLHLSSIAQRRGALDEAMAHTRHLLQVDPANEKAALRLASLLESVDLEKAEDQLRQILCRDPTSKGALLSLARVREKRQDQADAAHILHHLAAQHPADADIGLQHALILAATGCTAEAVAVLQRLADSSAASAKILFKLGDLKRQNGDLAGAEEIFARLVAMQPDNTQAWLRLANAQHAAGSTERALITLERLLASAPDNAAALLRKAELLAALRRDQEAIAAFENLVRKPDAPLAAWIGFARLTARTKSTKAAIASLRRTVDRFGQNVSLSLELARQTLHSGHDAEAQEIIDAALCHFPNDQSLLRMACLLHVLAGRFAAAEAQFPLPADPSPRDEVEALRFRAKLASVRWQLEDAVALHEKIGASAYSTAGDFRTEAGLRAMQLDIAGARMALRQAVDREWTRLRAQQKSTNISQGLVGQLVNDIWTDSSAVSAVCDADKQGSLGAWQAAICMHSHHTGAAMAFLIHLRRTGRFERLSTAPDLGGIPHHIHQFWDSPDLPSDVEELTESWRDLNPGWIYQRHTTISAQAFLQSLDDVRPARAFRQMRTAAGKADIFRLAVLFHQGGIYADADDRCVSPLVSFMEGRRLVLRQEQYGTIGNNFIASEPGHPVIGKALEHAVEAVLRGDAEMIWLSTGPGLLTRILAAHLTADGSAHLAALGRAIWVTDAHELRQFSVSHCSVAYKQTARNWQNAEFDQRRRTVSAAVTVASYT
jgi:tetratricopeptide (TPR) repeat protein